MTEQKTLLRCCIIYVKLLKTLKKSRKKIDEEEVDYHLDYWFILSASHSAFTSLKRFEMDAEN